jgi:hypothetical protein
MKRCATSHCRPGDTVLKRGGGYLPKRLWRHVQCVGLVIEKANRTFVVVNC